ncbi:MAG: diguanylate cyclase [Burkholderiales bacterium]|nr:diguanylate cyclase [Burkholderiales bacterium]
MPQPLPEKRSRLFKWLRNAALPAAAVVLALLLWGVDTLNNARQARERHQTERELFAVSSLQADSLVAWREQRLTDAATLTDDTMFAEAVSTWLNAPTDALQSLVQERLRTLQERARYTVVYFVDPHGNLLLNAGDAVIGRMPEPEREALRDAIAQATVGVVEPRRDPFFAFPFFSLLAPVFDGARPIGAIWLVSDVRTTLYPLLMSWPTPNESAEASIVTRSGADVLFVSPLRNRAGSELDFRVPLANASDPAVQAVSGVRGTFYGQDYRGKRVVAMLRAVPGSPWVTVTKVDEDEVFADARVREGLAISLTVSVGLLLAGLIFSFSQRQARLRELALKTELQRTVRWHESAQKTATVGYYAYDLVTGEFSASAMTRSIFGVAEGDSLNLKQWIGVLHPDDRERTLALHKQSRDRRVPLRVQYRVLRALDGQVRWVDSWGEWELAGGQVVRAVGTVQDITDRKAAEDTLAAYSVALEAMVRLDPLTQVANRRAMDEHLDTELNRARRYGAPVSLLMIDVDHFKAYNDHYGHVAGDSCLQAVAQAISSSVNRAGELVARYGGEEFAVVLPDVDAQQALAIAERTCAAVRVAGLAHAARPDSIDVVTVSIGVACVQTQVVEQGAATADDTAQVALFSGAGDALAVETGAADATDVPTAAEDARLLFLHADTALYAAKQAGRNQALVYAVP